MDYRPAKIGQNFIFFLTIILLLQFEKIAMQIYKSTTVTVTKLSLYYLQVYYSIFLENNDCRFRQIFSCFRSVFLYLK